MSKESEASEQAKKAPQASLTNLSFSIVSLGCPKNLVDSEVASGRLIQSGMKLRDDVDEVDLFVLNTCGFLRSAREEAESFISQAIESKRTGATRFLIVLGCVVASDGRELAEKYPQVDAWLSPFDESKIVEVVEALFNGEEFDVASDSTPTLPMASTVPARATSESTETPFPRLFYHPSRNLTLDEKVRARLTQPHVAYLKIADGCDRFCSYCAIPNLRGRYVSKPIESILDEAARLADQGVRELVLIAQETTFWGSDLYGKPDLTRLLATLKERGRFDWIRVLYAYPLFWDKSLFELFKLEEPGSTSIVPYIDMPLQHCNSELLKKMNRRVDKALIEDLLATLRAEIPNAVLRTSLIVGFPGETDEMFNELLEFVEKYRFERGGVFEFSPEPGTPAATMENQIDAKTKARRFERLSAKQERVSRRFARGLVGREIDVLLDERATSENGSVMKNVCLGRTYADAPDVDPIVYVTGRNLTPGEFERCEIVDASGIDLIAVPIDPEKIYVSKEERREAHEKEERGEASKKDGRKKRR